MRIKVGVMGSAEQTDRAEIKRTTVALAQAIASHDVVLFTGATTGLIYDVGKAVRDLGTLHIGISPAASISEHTDHYQLPTDACDVLVYTGFGLKGRNVVLVRSCDVVLFISGKMGSLNEFTIAHDEAKVIGCLTGTGGVADEVDYLIEKFANKPGARVIADSNASRLLDACIAAHARRE
jgi:uncharacterized protein (TIGR00725 family)